MLPILACPRCSSPRAKVFSRPTCYRGVRSARYMMVAAGACDHIDLYAAWNSGDEPDPLITRWNQEAEKMAAQLSTQRGHTPEQAAALLDALRPKTYRADGIHP